MPKKPRTKPAKNAVARCTFFNLAEMTPAARKEIAAWLRRTARFVVEEGRNTSSRFIARFWWS